MFRDAQEPPADFRHAAQQCDVHGVRLLQSGDAHALTNVWLVALSRDTLSDCATRCDLHSTLFITYTFVNDLIVSTHPELARDHFNELGHHVLGGIISPVHDAYGKDGLVAATHRNAMLRLSLQSSGWVRVSDWESMQQEQWSKTRAVLQYHQNYVNSLVNETREQSQDISRTPSLNGNEGTGLADWLPTGVRDCNAPIRLKLLCGADLLESFAVPNLWQPADVSVTDLINQASEIF